MNTIIELFQKPSATSIATKELEEAHRSLLEALSAAEWAKAMAQYHQQRIERLEAYLAQ